MDNAQPLITSRALDSLAVSSEVFVKTAQDILKYAKDGELNEVPFMFGHTTETMRPAGTIYIIPQAKRRAAFPLFWDTERFKYQFPKLFQALKGPQWNSSFSLDEDPNGTLHLQDGLLSPIGEDITDLPDQIDTYLDEKFPEKGLILLYRPLFSSVDRIRCLLIPEKTEFDEAITLFLREMYGFYPSTSVDPLAAVRGATNGVPEGYGVPVVKTAASSGWRYVSALSAKDAKKKTKFYTSYAIALSHGDEGCSVFRFKLVDSTPDWKSLKEMHSEAEDTITSKSASIDAPWLAKLENFESRKMASRLKSAFMVAKKVGEDFVPGAHEEGSLCAYCGDPAEGVITTTYDDPEDPTSKDAACASCWKALTSPVPEHEWDSWMQGSLGNSMDTDFDAGISADPTEHDYA